MPIAKDDADTTEQPPKAETGDNTILEQSGQEEKDDKDKEPEASAEPLPIEEPLPEPSPDRISISYAKNSRRLVIDANVVEEVCVHRAEAKIEIKIKLEPIAGHKASSLRYCQGVFVSNPAAD